MREKIVFAPIIAIIIAFGVYPKPLLNPINTSAQTLTQMIELKKPSNVTDRMIEGQNPYSYEHIPNDFDDEGVLIIPNIGD